MKWKPTRRDTRAIKPGADIFPLKDKWNPPTLCSGAKLQEQKLQAQIFKWEKLDRL